MTVASQDWQDALADYLIKAGTIGKKQSEIVTRFAGKMSAAQIISQLTAWHVEDKVQKFEVAGPARGGRGPVVWRATTKMLEPD